MMHQTPTAVQQGSSLRPATSGLARRRMTSSADTGNELSTSVWTKVFASTSFKANCVIAPEMMHAASGVQGDAVHWTRARSVSSCQSPATPARRGRLRKAWQLPTHSRPRCCPWWFSSDIATMKAYAITADPQGAQRVEARHALRLKRR